MAFRFLFALSILSAALHAATYQPRIYLGGPDVFFKDSAKVAETKKAIAAKYGFEGVYPLDNETKPQKTPFDTGMKIFAANVALMRSCDFMVANMLPFRGPSMDAGTAFEMGFMMASGKPVLGYTEDPASFVDRTTAYIQKNGGSVNRDADGSLRDSTGLGLENFGLVDNLMLHGVVHESRGKVESSFEDVLKKNSDWLHKRFSRISKK